MLDMALDNAIADHKTYGSVDLQHRLFARLRREDPVHWTQPDGHRPFWTISKYADIIAIERQPDRFINAPRTKLLSIDFESKVREAMNGRPMLVRALPQMDNPDHAKYQKLTHAWFQPRQLRTLADRMEALARESVDRLLALGGECDFYNDIAIHYPLRVLMTILGLPREDEARLLKITQAYFGGGDPEMQQGSDLIDATLAYVDYFKDVARERRQNPRDDVATIIATYEIDGRPIEDFEAYSYYVALASAGHDTTSATIAGGLLALIENPDAMARLQRNPDLIPDAAEEMVRWVSPVKHFFRTAAADYDMQNGFQFDYAARETTWFSGLPGLWVQDGACQSGVSPIFDRTRENLCSSDTGIAMTRRLLLETIGAYRDHGTRPRGVSDPDVFMVRAVSLRLPPEDRWADAGAPFMRARLGADFGYEL